MNLLKKQFVLRGDIHKLRGKALGGNLFLAKNAGECLDGSLGERKCGPQEFQLFLIVGIEAIGPPFRNQLREARELRLADPGENDLYFAIGDVLQPDIVLASNALAGAPA